ncbi:hypothetical protein D3C78_1022970 [compost metagenome]
MAISSLAGDGDNRQRFSAGRSALALADKQQVSVFHGRNRPVLARQLHQKTRIALVGLVQMVQRLFRQVCAQRHFQIVAGGNLFHHLTHRSLMPGFFTPGVQGFPKISATGAYSQSVRRAGMFDFIHGKRPFRE